MENFILQFEKHQDWPAVKSVCENLLNQGFLAYLAGGCVRDSLIGRPINDFDVATNAKPEDIEKIFPKTVAVGREFGVMVVVQRGSSIEVTSFRGDIGVRDGRRPEAIRYCGPEEDALRRDFTINGLFFDFKNSKLVDYVDGINDINSRTIRTIGEAQERFAEDYLRILRALRFKAQLGFELDSDLKLAIYQNKEGLAKLSVERVVSELQKLTKGPYATNALYDGFNLGVFEVIFPSWKMSWGSSCQVRQMLYGHEGEMTDIEALSVFFLPVFMEKANSLGSSKAEQELKEFLNGLKLSKKSREEVFKILVGCLSFEKIDDYQGLLWIDQQWGPTWLKVYFNWIEIHGSPESLSKKLDHLVDLFNSVCDDQGRLPKRLIEAKDLLEMGIKKGPELGDLLEKSYRFQLLNQISDRQRILSDLSWKV